MKKPTRNSSTNGDTKQTETFGDSSLREKIAEQITEAQRHLDELPESDCRGIPKDFLRKFGSGYLPKWRHVKMPNMLPSPRVIFPLGDSSDPSSLNAILTQSGREHFKNSKSKAAEKSLSEGNKLVFNPKAFDADIVPVTEGEFDCVSILFAGVKTVKDFRIDACALGGAGQFKDLIRRLESKEHRPKILILFDRDDNKSGQNHADELFKKLSEIGVASTIKFFDDFISDNDKQLITENGNKKIDANQILQTRGAKFLRNILREIISHSVDDFAKVEEELRQRQEPEPVRRDETKRENYSVEIQDLINEINTTITPADLEAKGYLKHSERGSARPDGYVCPYCGSGTGKHKTGALKFITDDGEPHFGCGKCGGGGSVITFLAHVKNLPTRGKEFFDTLKSVADEFSIPYDPKIFEYKPPKKRNSHDRIAELSAQPKSTARDEEIIAAIRDACEWRYSKDENGVLKKSTIKATYSNLQLIFDNDPNLIKLFGTDEFQGADVFLRRPSWRKDNCAGNVWTDRDDAQLRLYLRKNYGELSNRDLIQDFTVAVAQDNSFHPVKDFFRNLPRWDGTPRAEELFIKFLRVDDTPFAREITMKWLLGAVARIFHPGCRFQIALTIQGAQGIGKSYIFECLGGKWYGVLSDNMDDSHAQDAIQNLWIVEVKEFKAARQADINSVKAFIDTSTDNRRAPYERRPAPTPRHCAFGITVNDKQFLSDKTGNRRFPILESKSVPGDYVEGLTDEYIAQVWAEVYQTYTELFKDGFDEKKLEKALELSREAKLQVERVAENFMRDDDLANDLRGYLDTLIPAPVLWNLLTKEERSKFIADGKIFVGGGKEELVIRIRNRKWKKSAISDDINALLELLASKNEGTVYRNAGETGLYIYGTEIRQHICMSEILSEAFANGDKRKNTFRITEILSTLEGWTLGERLQKADPQYPDQRKPYYRNDDNLPTNDDDPPPQKDTTEKHEQPATFSPHEEQVKAGNSIEDIADLPIDPLENPPF